MNFKESFGKSHGDCSHCIDERSNPEQKKKGEFPDHTSSLARLRKIQGQLNGAIKMIADQRYCVDILVQFRAITAGINVVEAAILEKHIHNCVRVAIKSRNQTEINNKIDELMDLLSRRLNKPK